MEKALQIINELQRAGHIEKYAIAGGIALIFYMEPVATFDLDIFVILPEKPVSLAALQPIYDWMRSKGWTFKKEHIIIEGIPIQIIPAYNNLVEEAVENAMKITYKGVETYILKAEYLLAIMLQTYRPKDRTRIAMLLEQAEISNELLMMILEKHSLGEKYARLVGHTK